MNRFNAPPRLRGLARDLPIWLGPPLLVTLLGELAGGLLDAASLLLLYLLGVLAASLRTGAAGLFLCALLSFLAFTWFYTEPLHSLVIDNLNEGVAALLFMAIALLAGQLSFRLRRHLASLEVRDRFLRAQLELARRLERATRAEDVLPALHVLAREEFGGEVDFRLLPPASEQNPGEVWHLTWTLRSPGDLDADRQARLLSVRDQVQAFLERLAVASALQRAERKGDEERLRNTLLSAVSQDLRKPLDALVETATRLRGLESLKADADAQPLLEGLLLEARRLASSFGSLLDMTRLGHGRLPLSRAPTRVEDIVAAVLERIGQLWPRHQVQVRLPEDLPPLEVHAALVEQGLYHALHNALKAGGESSPVLLELRRAGPQLLLRVCDKGPGLPPEEWERVFDPFNTCKAGTFEEGAGLGLPLSRSIFRVHGGNALIVPPTDSWRHCLQLTLPLPAESTAEDSA